MTTQTTYDQKPAEGRAGARADMSVSDIISRVVDEANGIKPGHFLVQGTTPDDASLPVLAAADVDAFVLNGVSTAGIQTLDTTDANEFDGAVGLDALSPFASRVQMVIDSHADWDATTAVLTGIDENGQVVSENLSISDGGDETLTSVNYYARLLSLVIPAQSGTGGTFTLGTTTDVRFIKGQALGIAVLDDALEGPDDGSDFAFADDKVLGVGRKGRFWVTCENAFSPESGVYIRAVATSPEELGAFRAGDTDSGDCVFFPHARFVGSGSAGLAIVELDL